MSKDFLQIGFRKKVFVKGRRSIADMFPRTRRCGIYILHFVNGEFYVGQAINVTSRFIQHRINHLDIEYISFRCVSKKELNKAEREAISHLEALGLTLRNISLVSVITGQADLDEVVTPDDQQKWMNDELPWESFETERFDYPDQRKRYAKKYLQLKEKKVSNLVSKILQEYILFLTPYPRKTEYTFWSLTCQPQKNVLARVNIFWQETLRIFEYQAMADEATEKVDTTHIAVLFFVAKSVLFSEADKTYFENRYHSIHFPDLFYPTGGQDQQAVSCFSYEYFDIIADHHIYVAAKTFNLRLMRKGPCVFSRYHCFDLADEALINP
jgi:hypothetical protein